jgi:hypothetical protein
MVHDNNLSSTEELLRDYDATKCIAGSTACIANNMGITLFQTEGSGNVLMD